MPPVNGVGEPGAGEPHARFEVAGAGKGMTWPRSPGVAQPTGKPAGERPWALLSDIITSPAPDPTLVSPLLPPGVGAAAPVRPWPGPDAGLMVPAPMVPAPMVPAPMVPAPMVPAPMVPAPMVPAPMVPAPHGPGPPWSRPPMVPAPHGPGPPWSRPPMVPAPHGPGPHGPGPHGPGPHGPAPARPRRWTDRERAPSGNLVPTSPGAVRRAREACQRCEFCHDSRHWREFSVAR